MNPFRQLISFDTMHCQFSIYLVNLLRLGNIISFKITTDPEFSWRTVESNLVTINIGISLIGPPMFIVSLSKSRSSVLMWISVPSLASSVSPSVQIDLLSCWSFYMREMGSESQAARPLDIYNSMDSVPPRKHNRETHLCGNVF